MSIQFTQGKNYIKKPHSFAREPADEKLYETRISPGNSPEFNNPLISINKLTECYNSDCKNTELEYDYNRDELTCPLCGYVQRQGFTDYTGNEGLYQITSQEKKNKKLRKYNDM